MMLSLPVNLAHQLTKVAITTKILHGFHRFYYHLMNARPKMLLVTNINSVYLIDRNIICSTSDLALLIALQNSAPNCGK